jgi:ribA/ribD-fused uncharacterized protein
MASYIFFCKVGDPNGDLSNWCRAHMIYNGCPTDLSIPIDIPLGTEFPTCENFMMYCKARLFNDAAIAEQIRTQQDPAKVKALGRKVKNFDETIWDQHKFNIVVLGNWLKFTQHEDLADLLLGTNNKILVEAADYDPVWGIKFSAANAMANHHIWKDFPKGHENLLGQALMKVRERLQIGE